MIVSEEKFKYSAETERLVIKPLEKSDYYNWLHAFEQRYPAQHPYDKGKINMRDSTVEWFHQLVDKHQRLAKQDEMYIFSVF
ncbi:hypothetical protein SH601_14560 [Gracilibacillus sp. S3-1-1]|uniref:Uncharacterized protein n=1 Tax=Gracilibacillus pellucidus TaxID=3095368 RepID=A0ACC6M8N8_9BACI|nr:hypothetical protein [Gracilibacillus sp. S3-1-1]MDX8047207.1 hypothetical protein [Gracilibacillus sp. S3-1-1]